MECRLPEFLKIFLGTTSNLVVVLWCASKLVLKQMNYVLISTYVLKGITVVQFNQRTTEQVFETEV